MEAHKSSAPKAQCGLKTAHLQTTKMLVQVGWRMYSTDIVLTFVVQYCWPNAERGGAMGEKRHRFSEHVAPEQCALAHVSCVARVNATYLSLEIFLSTWHQSNAPSHASRVSRVSAPLIFPSALHFTDITLL